MRLRVHRRLFVCFVFSVSHELRCRVPHPAQRDIKLYNGIWQQLESPHLDGVETFWLFSAFVHSSFPDRWVAKINMVSHGEGIGMDMLS